MRKILIQYLSTALSDYVEETFYIFKINNLLQIRKSDIAALF